MITKNKAKYTLTFTALPDKWKKFSYIAAILTGQK